MFDDLAACPLDDLDDVHRRSLTSGQLNIPGGFGWLSFGLDGNGDKCDWDDSLGHGRRRRLRDEPSRSSTRRSGRPQTRTAAARRSVSRGSVDLIGSLTGNEWGDLSFYIDEPDPRVGPDLGHGRRHGRATPTTTSSASGPSSSPVEATSTPSGSRARRSRARCSNVHGSTTRRSMTPRRGGRAFSVGATRRARPAVRSGPASVIGSCAGPSVRALAEIVGPAG